MQCNNFRKGRNISNGISMIIKKVFIGAYHLKESLI